MTESKISFPSLEEAGTVEGRHHVSPKGVLVLEVREILQEMGGLMAAQEVLSGFVLIT